MATPQISDKELKELVKYEYMKCASDMVYFFKKYGFIQHPNKGSIKFNLYPFQERVLEQLVLHDYNIILKSRQLGISTLAAGYALHLMLFNTDKNILAIATKQDTAKNLVNKVQHMYKNLPSWLKIPSIELNKLSLRLKNGSTIKAVSSSPDSGRSEAVSVLIIDEAAFIDGIDEIWGSAQQTLATGGRAIVLSCVTSNTMIFSNDGLHEMSDYIIDDNVGGYKIKNYNVLGYGNILRTGKLFFNNGVVNTKKITTKFSELECSENHKLLAYVNDESEYRWPIIANDLKVGDYIAIQKNYDLFGNDDFLEKYYTDSNKLKYKTRFDYISNELAYFFGLYISEGYANSKNNQCVITCGDDISWVFDHLGVNYSCYDELHYYISNKNIIELLEYVGFDLTNKAYDKIIPDRLLRMSKEKIIWMIKGMFDGDGSASNKIINYTSTSEKLINQIRMLLLNLNILSHKYVRTVKYMENRRKINGGKIKHNHDLFVLEIYGKNTLMFYNKIGFNFERKQNKFKLLEKCNFNRRTSTDIIPNSLELVKMLYQLSGENTLSIRNKYGLNINGIVNKKTKYKTNNISREIVILMFNLFSHLLDDDVKIKWSKIIDDDIVWVPITKIERGFAETFDFSLNNINIDEWDHSVVYNGIIAEQTPNGVGNFFHEEWEKASSRIDESKFHPIRLHWSMHPDRNQSWRDEQDKILGKRLAAQECDANFNTSGETVIDMNDILFFEKEYVVKPVEERGEGRNLWIWKRPIAGHLYIVSADVSRGDSADNSAAHIFDAETMEQVGEYRGKIDDKSFGDMLVSISTEYNDALLVIENSNVGWAAIQQVINRGYKNLYYTKQNVKYIDSSKYNNKLNNLEKKSVAGFSTTTTLRPLIISKLEEYCRERGIILHSSRLISELKVFVWKNGKPQAMTKKYNDDLVMALSILLWVRDTSMELLKNNISMQKSLLDNIQKSADNNNYYTSIYSSEMLAPHDPWKMPLPVESGEMEDLTNWL